MIAKMRPEGSRIGIVFNGSPLFTGDAGSGESEIRRWIIENDWLEAIVALPDQLFYNTGIHTYIWIVTNRKSARRRGKIQLVNAVDFYRKMRKSLGNKRNELAPEHIEEITRTYGDFVESKHSKIFDNEDFGYRKITVERPLRLNFQVSPERIARLDEEGGFQNLAKSRKKGAAGQKEAEEGRALQSAIREALSAMDPKRVYLDRDEFSRVLKRTLGEANLHVSPAVFRAIMNSLSERDPTAEACLSKGKPEPDTELRSTENVPLRDDVQVYFEREVQPFVHDSWFDGSQTKIGYEIPFTRYFYEYTAGRPIDEIRREIRDLEQTVEGMLEEVLA